jgi:hypothetical protein
MRRAWLASFALFICSQPLVAADPPPAGRLETVAAPENWKALGSGPFLAYLLEDHWRDTNPTSGLMPLDVASLEAFVTRRKATVDSLTGYMQKVDELKVLATPYQEYRDLLAGKEMTGYIRGTKERIAQYEKGLAEIVNDERTKEALENIKFTWSVFAQGLSAASQAQRGDREVAGFLGGAAEWAEKYPEHVDELVKIWAEANRRIARYIADEKPKLERDLKTLRAEFVVTFGRKRDAAVRAARAAVKLVKTPSGDPIPFDPEYDPKKAFADRPPNPFVVKSLVLTAPAPTDRGEKGIEAVQKLSTLCFHALKLVPEGRNYNPIRAELAAAGGTYANQGVLLATGDAGFSKGPCRTEGLPAHKLAMTAVTSWQEYVRNETPELVDRPVVLQQRVVALAAVGKPTDAHLLYTRYRKNLKAPPITSPEMWYQLARVCALRTNPSGGALPDYTGAVNCLRTARLLGFDRVDEAENCPDLDKLRRGTAAVQEAYRAALSVSSLVGKGSR